MNLRVVAICAIVVGLLVVGFEAGSQEKAKKEIPAAKILKPRTELLSLGDEAPHFSLLSHEGTTVTLSEFRGKKRVLLVFYPGDDTPASTRQLSSFRDRYEMFTARDVVVLGINSKKAESHKAFVKKLRLPFPLLVDKGGKVAAAYGCRAPDGKIKQTIYVIGTYARVELAQRGDLPWIDLIDAIDEARYQGPPQ